MTYMLMLGLGKKGRVVGRERGKERGLQAQAVDCLRKRKKEVIFP